MTKKNKKSSDQIRRGRKQRKDNKKSKRKGRGYYIDKERAQLMELRNAGGQIAGRNGINVAFPEELLPLLPKEMK